MDAVVEPRALSGTIEAIASKSEAHRMLICAAFADGATNIRCRTTSEDIDATVGCLRALGSGVARTRHGFRVVPLRGDAPEGAELDCGESGSTLRFLLPVVGALGRGATLDGRGRLAARPLSPLYEEMIAGGCDISEQGRLPLEVSGRLRAGTFELPGDVSSQFVTGLLLAAPLMDGAVTIRVSEPIQSRPYIDVTRRVMADFGVEVASERVERDGANFTELSVGSEARYRTPGTITVGGDWSNAAVWLSAGAIGRGPVTVKGLDLTSTQGDRAILGALSLLGARVVRGRGVVAVAPSRLTGQTIDVSAIPDLVPPLAAVAALAEGETRLAHAERLRLKESDRMESVTSTVNALGGDAAVDGDDIVIHGGRPLHGGLVEVPRDHRICMEAALLATRCDGEVTIRGAECVDKSYPGFFEDLRSLGGRCRMEGTEA
jgi:3-phosphoshikimate 1-carboxyvinyltransferase